MKFIIDQQLPPRLAAWLRERGYEASHTREILRRDAPDTSIWATACETGAVVVSKDEDFVLIHARLGGARLVWVRIGNCDNPTLVRRFEESWDEVIAALESGADLVELR